MKIVADKGQVTKGHGWAAIMVRKDLAGDIKDFKDLKGRKIGLPSKGVSVYTQLGRALSLGGLTIDDADIIQVGFANMIPALTNKAIDVAMLIEPFTTLVAQRGLAVRWKGIDEYYPFKAQNGVVMYGENFTKEQPDAAKRWMIAYLRGVRAYEDAVSKGIDRDAVFGILAKHTAVKNIKLYSKMRPIYFDPNGRVEVRSLELDQDWFLKLGLQLKRADLSKLIDYQYIDYAAAQLKKH
jgi:NitT/TauT family transport system substrate-binding protein